MQAKRSAALAIYGVLTGLLLLAVFALPLRLASRLGCVRPEQTPTEFRALTATLFASITEPRRRARHEGMMLYLVGQIDRVITSSEAAARAAAAEAQWWAMHDALEMGRDVLGSKRGRFQWAYRSRADASAQPITLEVPAQYDGTKPVPLLVGLHDRDGTHDYRAWEPSSQPHIRLAVGGRGDAFYRALGELDVREAVAFVKSQYNIDARRIALHGTGMGGWGALRLATRRPDAFAGVAVFGGWACGLDLPNVAHLPVQLHHGQADRRVPLDYARLAVGALREAHSPVRYQEYPGVVGSLAEAALEHKPVELLLAATAAGLPRRIAYTTTQPTRGRCQWLTIEALTDPHRPGAVQLAAESVAVRAATRNVAALRLHSLPALFPSQRRITVVLDGQRLTLTAPSDEALFRRDAGRWHRVQPDPPPPAARAPRYQRGGFFNLYDGRPIRIVAPPAWEKHRHRKRLIPRCAAASDMREPMPHGRIPIVHADRVQERHLRGHLVLVGGPDENRVVAELLPRLPAAIRRHELWLDGIGHFPMDSIALCLTHPNPWAPACRIVWLLNATLDTFPIYPLLTYWSWVSYYPDVVLHDRSHGAPVLIAAANYGHGWAPPDPPQHPRLLVDSIQTVNAFARAAAAACRKRLRADAALYRNEKWGDAKALAGGRLTLSSLKALVPLPLQPVVRARLTAAQFRELRAQLDKDERFQITPPADRLTPKARYTLVFCEPLIETLGRTLPYTFPQGSLAPTGTDVHDCLPDLTRPQHD